MILTIDRKQFKDGKEAYLLVKEKKLIAGFVRNLKRTGGIGVIDWLWVMEFHEDGFSHWHVFIEVGKEGKSGMIGGALIRKYWKIGSYLIESYVKNEFHWKNLVGYFGDHGYFSDGKGYQGVLPEWAKKEFGMKIRRSGSMLIEGCHEGGNEMGEQKEFSLKEKRPMREYEVILANCGSTSMIEISNEVCGIGRVVEIPYVKLRALFGVAKWVDGVGLVKSMNGIELMNFLKSDPGTMGLWHDFRDEMAINGEMVV